MNMLGKGKVPTERLQVFVNVARKQYELCTDENRRPALAEAHDLFEELLNWRLMHEARQGDDGPVV